MVRSHIAVLLPNPACTASVSPHAQSIQAQICNRSMIRRLCLGSKRFWMSAGQCRCDARLGQSGVLRSAREHIVFGKTGELNAAPPPFDAFCLGCASHACMPGPCTPWPFSSHPLLDSCLTQALFHPHTLLPRSEGGPGANPPLCQCPTHPFPLFWNIAGSPSVLVSFCKKCTMSDDSDCFKHVVMRTDFREPVVSRRVRDVRK